MGLNELSAAAPTNHHAVSLFDEPVNMEKIMALAWKRSFCPLYTD